MAYKRKTKDVWEVQEKLFGKWGVLCVMESMKSAHEKLVECQTNDKKGVYRVLKKRVQTEHE